LVLSVSVPVYAESDCDKTKKQLRGSLNVLQGNGGLWGFMEQSGAGLRNKSTLGFHLDNKFTRTVVIFEELCGNGSGKEIEAALLKQVQEGFDHGRAIKSMETSPDEILGAMEQLKKNLDHIIKKYDH